jgi:acyl CoA:acetate/3-ketoacid CoA transferase beta subunit
MMGATQIDRFGNQNIACIGPWAKPKAMLLGVRGGPGNTLNHPTSYWVPNHSTRSFVPEVDCVSGVGWDRVPKGSERFHEIRRVVSNLAVMDFETPEHSMRLRSVHPGVTVDEVVAATGFELVVPDDVPETRLPTGEELHLIREVLDPDGLREAEVKA